MKNKEVIIVMGSQSDYRVMKEAAQFLKKWKVRCETLVVSAHRTPQLMEKSVQSWEKEGVKVIIAGAGGAAHLPGMLASFSVLPVIGVPIKNKSTHGLDSLLSIAQMPRGVPVATVAIDNAENAALLAVKILAAGTGGGKLTSQLKAHKKNLYKAVLKMQKQVKRLSRNI